MRALALRDIQFFCYQNVQCPSPFFSCFLSFYIERRNMCVFVFFLHEIRMRAKEKENIILSHQHEWFSHVVFITEISKQGVYWEFYLTSLNDITSQRLHSIIIEKRGVDVSAFEIRCVLHLTARSDSLNNINESAIQLIQRGNRSRVQ